LDAALCVADDRDNWVWELLDWEFGVSAPAKQSGYYEVSCPRNESAKLFEMGFFLLFKFLLPSDRIKLREGG
jgi:hypothetical protein